MAALACDAKAGHINHLKSYSRFTRTDLAALGDHRLDHVLAVHCRRDLGIFRDHGQLHLVLFNQGIHRRFQSVRRSVHLSLCGVIICQDRLAIGQSRRKKCPALSRVLRLDQALADANQGLQTALVCRLGELDPKLYVQIKRLPIRALGYKVQDIQSRQDHPLHPFRISCVREDTVQFSSRQVQAVQLSQKVQFQGRLALAYPQVSPLLKEEFHLVGGTRDFDKRHRITDRLLGRTKVARHILKVQVLIEDQLLVPNNDIAAFGYKDLAVIRCMGTDLHTAHQVLPGHTRSSLGARGQDPDVSVVCINALKLVADIVRTKGPVDGQLG